MSAAAAAAAAAAVARFLPGFAHQKIEVNGVGINCAVAGEGPPVLLMHGHPHTLIIWRKVAQQIVDAGYTVVATDLRGYGDSDKPEGGEGHINYSKREMARDQVGVMEALGYRRFHVIGHDRGGRVAHRMALDRPEAVGSLIVIDIAPTAVMYALTDKEFATRYFWWFFLIQPFDLPERMIGADVRSFLRTHIDGQMADASAVDAETFEEYLRCYANPATIHSVCEDYRAAASIDLDHDAADAERKVSAPMLALWGAKGTVGKLFDVLGIWRDKALSVEGAALDCKHSLQEEVPEVFLEHALAFLAKH
jgi:haloacetate dehalogenase